MTVSGITSPAATTITAYDSSTPRQSATVSIDCSGAPPPPTPSALVIAPNNFNYSADDVREPDVQLRRDRRHAAVQRVLRVAASGRVDLAVHAGRLGPGVLGHGLTNGVLTTNITVADSSTPQLQGVATITCPITSPPTGPLTVTPPGYDYSTTTPATCIGQTSNFVITGGTPPYYVAFPTPPNAGATINPTTVTVDRRRVPGDRVAEHDQLARIRGSRGPTSR